MENISKNKRGRPRSTHDSMRDYLAKEFPHVTDRTRRNIGYMLSARVALGNGSDERFAYLVGKGNGRCRSLILTELGRFDEPKVIQKLALQICQQKLKTADAIARLRSLRKTAKPPTERDLRQKLAVCVDQWMLRDGATLAKAVAALRNVLSVVESMNDGNGCR